MLRDTDGEEKSYKNTIRQFDNAVDSLEQGKIKGFLCYPRLITMEMQGLFPLGNQSNEGNKSQTGCSIEQW